MQIYAQNAPKPLGSRAPVGPARKAYVLAQAL